ncbi:hypothetical protein HDV02_006323 [Globomyces sp. JEL0801]|nr:hypothetical protein HDV02_006323 [Globomyces sp. JEL0801]
MSYILTWIANTITNSTATAVHPSAVKEQPVNNPNDSMDDWCILDENANPIEEDASSSIATIEPVRVLAMEKSLLVETKNSKEDATTGLQAHLPLLQQALSETSLAFVKEGKIRTQRQPPTLAQLKDKELKMRKMAKYQYHRRE